MADPDHRCGTCRHYSQTGGVAAVNEERTSKLSGTCWAGFTPRGRLMFVESSRLQAWKEMVRSNGIQWDTAENRLTLRKEGYTVRKIKWFARP